MLSTLTLITPITLKKQNIYIKNSLKHYCQKLARCVFTDFLKQETELVKSLLATAISVRFHNFFLKQETDIKCEYIVLRILLRILTPSCVLRPILIVLPILAVVVLGSPGRAWIGRGGCLGCGCSGGLVAASHHGGYGGGR